MEIIEKNVVVLGVDRYNILQKDQTKFKLLKEKNKRDEEYKNERI